MSCIISQYRSELFSWYYPNREESSMWQQRHNFKHQNCYSQWHSAGESLNSSYLYRNLCMCVSKPTHRQFKGFCHIYIIIIQMQPVYIIFVFNTLWEYIDPCSFWCYLYKVLKMTDLDYVIPYCKCLKFSLEKGNEKSSVSCCSSHFFNV